MPECVLCATELKRLDELWICPNAAQCGYVLPPNSRTLNETNPVGEGLTRQNGEVIASGMTNEYEELALK